MDDSLAPKIIYRCPPSNVTYGCSRSLLLEDPNSPIPINMCPERWLLLSTQPLHSTQNVPRQWLIYSWSPISQWEHALVWYGWTTRASTSVTSPLQPLSLNASHVAAQEKQPDLVTVHLALSSSFRSMRLNWL